MTVIWSLKLEEETVSHQNFLCILSARQNDRPMD